MNWTRAMLDGIASSLVFNVGIAIFYFIMPHAYAHMMPKDIKKAAEPYSKMEIKNLVLVVYILFFAVIAWMIISAQNAKIEGFWNLFWTAYIEMLFVNFGDFIILDCLLMSFARKNARINGTESCASWEIRQYMKEAIPEHFIVWPLVICTLVSFASAGIGIWLS